MKIAVITVDFNGHADTRDLVESYKKLDKKLGEVILIAVDNGSDQYLGEVISEAGIVILQSGENLGFAGGYNRGLAYANEWGADYCLIVNNDVVFDDPKLLAKLVKVLESKDSAGVVVPKIKFAPGYEFFAERYAKSETGKVIWYAGGEFDWDNVAGKHRGIDEVDHGQYDRVEKTGFVTGCILMIKREVLAKAGYLDEGLFAYFEDGDWMQRVAAAGYEMWYCGKTSVWHKVSRTAGIGSEFSDYMLTRNRLYFGMRYASLRTKLALVREMGRRFVSGRPAQRKGIVDFLLGKKGPGPMARKGQGTTYPVKLSIVAINYKTPELTEKLVQSIYQPKSGISKYPMEVLILDNASGDGVGEIIKTKYPQVQFFQNTINTGFAGGNNQLIRLAAGEFVLLLNSDIEVLPGALSAMVELAQEKKGEAVIVGKLIFPDKTIQDSCFNLPTVERAVEEYFLGHPGQYFMYLPRGTEPTRVEGAVMACFLIPRKVLNRVGLLSEGSFMYFEDIEFCRRLKKAGIPVYFEPKARFIHHHGASSKKIGTTKSQEYLRKGSVFYHGRVKYALLWMVLWLGQRWGKVKTPESRWKG